MKSKFAKLLEELDGVDRGLVFRTRFLNEGSSTSVDWDFKKITVIKSSLGKKPPGGGGPPPPPSGPKDPDSPDVIDIDQPESDGGSGGDDNKDSESPKIEDSEVKIGAIVQDHKSGKKGRIVNIDGTAIEIEPLTDEEIRSAGYIALGRNTTRSEVPEAPRTVPTQRIARSTAKLIDPRNGINTSSWEGV